METIKSCTDLSQSRKLSEILPIESADGYWDFQIDGYNLIADKLGYYKNDSEIPCWSLAALFKSLPVKDGLTPAIVKTPTEEYCVVYTGIDKDMNASLICNNPIDACYEMIIKLHEQKLL